MRKILLALPSVSVAAGPATAQVLKLSASDRDYVIKAAKANNYELEAARVATSMAGGVETKAFADSMITDQSKMAGGLQGGAPEGGLDRRAPRGG